MAKISVALKLSFALACAGAAWAAQAQQPNVSVSVDGVIRPGVYGRVVIGNNPLPAVIYPQPVIIAQPTVVVPQSPIYMHVPPGHAKKWHKHCYKYNACNQQVYFVQNDYRGYEQGRGRGHGRDRDDDDRGHGRKHGGKHGGKHHD